MGMQVLGMRHFATLCVLLGLAGAACGPRAEEGFPPTSPAAPTRTAPSGVPSPGDRVPPPAAGDPSRAAGAAREALQLLWKGDAPSFHAGALMQARQEDSAVGNLRDALVENVVKPLGPLREVRPATREEFELPGDWQTVGIFPSPEIGQLEQDRYGPSMQESWWRLRAERGTATAAVVVVPEAGGFRVQTLMLRTERLGTALTAEAPEDRAQLMRLLELVRTGRAREVYEDLASPGLREELSSQRLDEAVARLREHLPEGRLEARFVGGRRWFSSEGWTRTCQYLLEGRKGELHLVVHLHQEDQRLEGLTWDPVEGEGGRL